MNKMKETFLENYAVVRAEILELLQAARKTILPNEKLIAKELEKSRAELERRRGLRIASSKT